MKKFSLMFMLLLAVSFCLVTSNVSALNIDDDISNSIINSNIQEVVVVSYGSNCVVALRMKDVFLDTKVKEIKAEIADNIKTQFNMTNVYVTTSIKNFVKVKQIKESLKTKSPIDIYKELIELTK